MKQFLKELFCRHIYKTVKREYLYTNDDTQALCYYNTSGDYKLYSYMETEQCQKCGKVKYVRHAYINKVNEF